MWIILYLILTIVLVVNITLLLKTKNGRLKWSLVFLFLSLVIAALFRVILPIYISSYEAVNIMVVLPVVIAMSNTTYTFFTYNKSK